MELVKKCVGAALCAAFVGTLLKKNAPELSLVSVIAAAMITVFLCLETLEDLMTFIKGIAYDAQLPEAATAAIIKASAAASVTKLASDVCRDAGHQSTATALEFAGALAALYGAIPVFEKAAEMIRRL